MNRLLLSFLVFASAAPSVLAQDAGPATATPPDVVAAARQLKKSARQSYQQGDPATAHEHLAATLSLYRRHGGDDRGWWCSRLAEVAGEYLRGGDVQDALAILGEAADLDLPLEALSDDRLAVAAAALHRRLAEISADERFEMLHKWSMPAESRASVRVLTSITPTDAPPSVFARALGERPHRDSFAVPVVGEVRGLFSTAWELVKAAEESGHLRRLGAEISALAENKDPRAQFVDLLVRIVNAQRQDEALRATLIQRAADTREPSERPSDDSDLVIAAACLTHDWLQPIGEDIFKMQLERSVYLEARLLHPFLHDAYAAAVRRRFDERSDDLMTGAGLPWWVAAGGSAAAQSYIRPMWLSHQDHVLHLAGPGHDYLLFKYPLTGPFEFTCEAQTGGRDDPQGGVAYGGLSYDLKGADAALILRDASGRQLNTLPCPFVAETKLAAFNTLSLRSTDRGVTFCANGHPTWTDTSKTGASPWLGLRAFGHRTAVFRHLKISGNPVVPREVQLATDDSLRDWMFAGEEQRDWFAEGGVIHGQQVADGVVAQSSIHYFRPLQNNESISYDFQYDPGQLEAHPMLGRLAFLVEPNGVRLHWLTNGDSDWTGLSEDNAVAEPLERRGPKPLPLKSGDWNRVSVSLANETLKLSLNEVEIYARKMAAGSERTFGFYHDRTRSSARVRNVVLRGDWPERLTAEQFENLAAVAARRTESERRVLAAMFNDRHVPGSVLGVCDQAAKLPPEQRYEFLSAWVLPNMDHDSLRMAFDFTPSHPAPAVRLVSIADAVGRTRVAVGSDLVCPAIDLLQLAKHRGQLDQLRQQVERSPTKTSDDLRSRATMLALIDVAERDFIAANRNLDLLESLVQSADLTSFTEHWPETLAILAGVTHPEIREAAGDLAGYLLGRLRDATVSGPDAWERTIGSLAAQLKPLDPSQPLDAVGETPATVPDLKNWSPVSYTTARTRGQGFPLAGWQLSAAQVDHISGHHEDYLFYRVPLRGDFEVECELGGFGWRDTELMVAGTWLGPFVDHVTYVVGNFREERLPVQFDPRLPTTGEWIRQRTVVKDGVATTFLNGRRLHEEALPPGHDPWLAIRSPFFGFGGARDVRITGTPEIPRQIHISAPAGLPGWLPYFDETVGDDEGDWQSDENLEGGGIVGSRRTDLPGSGLERLLRYHRPMLEDGSIEYEFYYSAGVSSEGRAHVHPALDRRVFILDPAGVRIHWVTDGPYDRTKQDPFNLSDEPANRRGPANMPLKSDSWNRLRLDLSGDTVRLTLNGQFVYECDLEPTNQRTFGLFHYADQTAARVRNVVWQGDWPLQLPPVDQQELADHRTDILDARLAELTDVFEHDFARDGFPLWRFHVYDAGWEENIEAKPDGLHVRRPCGKESVRFVVSPRMHVWGDFDAIAEYEQLVVSPTADGSWGVSLRSVFADKDTTLCSVFRGLRRIPGEVDQPMAIGEFTKWKPGGGTDIWYPGQVAEESPSGRLRLSRRGDKVYSFIAERDSPNFRHIHTERVTTEHGTYDGIRLRVGAWSAVDGVGAASVVWKRLVVRAERITRLPTPPVQVQKTSPLPADERRIEEGPTDAKP